MYGLDDESLGFTTFDSFSDFPASQMIGIVASEDFSLHRINLWTGMGTWTDVSDIGIYVIPEPASVAVFTGVLGMVLIVCRHRKRHSA